MTISDIINWLNAKEMSYFFCGNLDCEIIGFSSLSNYKKGTITWIKKSTAYDDAGKPNDLTCAIVQRGVEVTCPNAIYVDASKEVFFGILRQFWGTESQKGSIGEGTVLLGNVTMDNSVTIGSNCTITGNVTLGRNSIIENNVVIQGNVQIGNDCIIHSGAVIGCDGYGLYFEEDGTIGKVEHFGGVEIEDDVEIGANACIDRGTIDNTFIGKNSKIDNLVHIAHNVQIGQSVCVVAGAVICGSAKLHDNSYIAPGAIVKNQLAVGENAFLGIGAVATKEIEDNTVYTGIPAKPLRKVKMEDK